MSLRVFRWLSLRTLAMVTYVTMTMTVDRVTTAVDGVVVARVRVTIPRSASIWASVTWGKNLDNFEKF